MGQGTRRLWAVAPIVVAATFLLLGLWLAAWFIRHRVVAPEVRAEAVRLLSRPNPPVRGRDGTDDWWTLARDVPRAERPAVAAAHRATLYAREDLVLAGQGQQASRLVDPLTRYPRLPDYGQGRWQCDPKITGCLRHVREDKALADGVLRDHAAMIERQREFAGFDGVRIGRIPRNKADQPKLAPGRRLMHTALAARFARGDHQGAIAATCRDLAGWRRIGADNDFEPMGATAARVVRYDLGLLAEMLLELPADHVLPTECASALAPPTDAEFSICPAMRSEFQDYRAWIDRPDPGADWRDRRPAIDPDRFVSVDAPRYARYCDPRMLAAARADRSATQVPEATVGCGFAEWVTHFPTCWIAVSDDRKWVDGFDAYVDWRTDQAASIALMRTWLWLRKQSDNPHDWWALLDQRPPSLGLRREPDMGAGKLVIDLLDTSRFRIFGLPLPEPPPCPRDAPPASRCGPVGS
jgi:hypothetical protein